MTLRQVLLLLQVARWLLRSRAPNNAAQAVERDNLDKELTKEIENLKFRYQQ